MLIKLLLIYFASYIGCRLIIRFFIVGRLCHWTKNDIVGDDPYNQKMIQIKIERLLSMYDNMFKA